MNEALIEKVRNEILAVMWRYSSESDITILECIVAAHKAAERIAQIALLQAQAARENIACRNRRKRPERPIRD